MSAQFVHAPTRHFSAGTTIAQYLRVKLSAGVLALAGSTDHELGTAESRYISGDPAAVRLRTAEGTCLFVAVDAISAGNPCYAAASGKISASGTVLIGIALEASTANGDIIEVLRRQEASDSAAAGGTTAAAFLIDSDATTPKIELAGQTAGTGDYKVTIKPASTLTADRVVTIPDAATQVMVGDTATQTMTNKTLTTPTIAVILMTGTTGNQEIRLTTNLADALSIEDTAGDLIVIDTTTGTQIITITPAVTITGSFKQGATAGDQVAIKGHYLSAVVAVTIPSFAAETTDSVDVDVSAGLTMQPAVGDVVIAIPQEALPTDCLLAGAIVTATDTVRVSFDAKEGGGVTGAAKNFKFFVLDLT